MASTLMYVIGKNNENEFGLNNIKYNKLSKHKCGIKNIHCGYQYNIYDDGNKYWSAGNNEYGSCCIIINSITDVQKKYLNHWLDHKKFIKTLVLYFEIMLSYSVLLCFF